MREKAGRKLTTSHWPVAKYTLGKYGGIHLCPGDGEAKNDAGASLRTRPRIVEAVQLENVGEQRQQDDDRKWHAQQPHDDAFTHSETSSVGL